MVSRLSSGQGAVPCSKESSPAGSLRAMSPRCSLVDHSDGDDGKRASAVTRNGAYRTRPRSFHEFQAAMRPFTGSASGGEVQAPLVRPAPPGRPAVPLVRERRSAALAAEPAMTDGKATHGARMRPRNPAWLTESLARRHRSRTALTVELSRPELQRRRRLWHLVRVPAIAPVHTLALRTALARAADRVDCEDEESPAAAWAFRHLDAARSERHAHLADLRDRVQLHHGLTRIDPLCSHPHDFAPRPTSWSNITIRWTSGSRLALTGWIATYSGSSAFASTRSMRSTTPCTNISTAMRAIGAG